MITWSFGSLDSHLTNISFFPNPSLHSIFSMRDTLKLVLEGSIDFFYKIIYSRPSLSLLIFSVFYPDEAEKGLNFKFMHKFQFLLSIGNCVHGLLILRWNLQLLSLKFPKIAHYVSF